MQEIYFLSEKDSRPTEPEPYLYQSLPRAYEPNAEATQWPSLLSGVLDSAAANGSRFSASELRHSKAKPRFCLNAVKRESSKKRGGAAENCFIADEIERSLQLTYCCVQQVCFVPALCRQLLKQHQVFSLYQIHFLFQG